MKQQYDIEPPQQQTCCSKMALMYVHKDIDVYVEECVDLFE